jgi:hypothetical protein
MGLILWNLYKERHRRIFKCKGREMDKIWEVIWKNIIESIVTSSWAEEDQNPLGVEFLIFNSW